MRVFAAVPALSVLLAAASSYAQAPAAPAPKPVPSTQTAPAPRPQTQTPATPSKPDPAAPAAQAAAAVPFRAGAKWGYINVPVIAAQSDEGKSAGARIKALQEERQKEMGDKQKALQATQQKLETEGALRNDAARAALQSDVDRQQRELQRFVEDAEQDIERLTNQLQQEFMTKLQPAIDRVVKEKQVDFIFSNESGIVYAAPDLNLTMDVIRAIDSAKPGTDKPAAATPQAPAPTAPAGGASAK